MSASKKLNQKALPKAPENKSRSSENLQQGTSTTNTSVPPITLPSESKATSEQPKSSVEHPQWRDEISFLEHRLLEAFENFAGQIDKKMEFLQSKLEDKTPTKDPDQESQIGFDTWAGDLKFRSENTHKEDRRASILPRKLSGSDSENDILSEKNADDIEEEDDFFKINTAHSKKRMSVLQRVAHNADKPRHVVQYTRQPPKFDHIKLEKLTIRDIFQFIDDINEYQVAHGITLPVPTLVSHAARDLILARYSNLTMTKFYELSTSKLIHLIQQQVRPETMLAFQINLSRNCSFELPKGYKPTASNFRPFYDALLQYKAKFLRVYEIMAEDNEENIPETNNKDGGLAKIFIEKIPFEYGTRTFRTLKEKKFKDIYVFLKKFFDSAKLHYELSKQANYMTQHFGGTEYLAGNSGKPLPRPSKPNTRAINAIDIEEEQDAYVSSEDEQKIYIEEQIEKLQMHKDEIDYNSDCIDDSLSAFSSTNPRGNLKPGKQVDVKKKDFPHACFQLLFYGKCQKGSKCPHSHDYASLNQAHGHYLKLLSESKYKSPTSILKKPPNTLNELPDESDKLADPTRILGDNLVAEIEQQTYLSSMPECFLFSACHREGSILLDNGDSIPVDKALFDTGAICGSYIASNFVQKYLGILEKFLIPCNHKVKLADNKTVAPIRNSIDLNIQFIGENGYKHKARITFSVLDTTSNDMIIGLPAIVKHFSDLHKEMIDSAVNELDAHHDMSTISIVDDNALVKPWTIQPEEEAPEDASTPLPSSFSEPLYYMEMSFDEAYKEFIGLIPDHVSEEFRNSTKIVDLLKDKGVQVFVPRKWEGIKGIPPLKLKFREGMPLKLKPRARPVNPKLYETARQEFDRLMKYFYRPSKSPVASCLVVAPKATKPFIRFCGDYVYINKYIMTQHHPIPNVQQSLEKIISYKIFLDFDWVNSFHQFLLDDETSSMLSVQTPWGQVEPKFMPEGIPPASAELQSAADDIFGDYKDWCIAIFDNLLVLATDYDDAHRKTEIILNRCIERNVYLKFSKTWLGFDHAKFFGYICRHGSYELGQDRKQALQDIAFPKSLKQMQSFLGAALFFKSFIPHYSTLTAPLHDMAKQSFNWTDETTWTVDYRSIFDNVKQALMSATAIFYPNYELEWILRTDASLFGVGAVLLQVYKSTEGSDIQLQPIGFASKKFSQQATRWSTIEQEAFGIFFGVHYFAYYLQCKPFILETDHNNLLWIEASLVPKVVRWRVYLQSFNFLLRHIPGKQNLVADWLSRADTVSQVLHLLSNDPGLIAAPDNHPDLPRDTKPTPEDILKTVHGGRMGHFGTRKTWKTLNELYPGHHIPYRVVEDFVSSCAVCQKDRLGMTDGITPLVRVLKPEHKRSTVGIDTLTITPPDENGNEFVTVIVNHFTKLTGLYPSKTHTAIDAAQALFQYCCTYGLVDSIISDPGSEFMNEVLEHLTKWFGIRHVFSLVDRHESNGVERTNRSILRHLKALVMDERVQHRWSHCTVLPLVQFLLNSFDNSESGVVPFHAHFGSADATYFKLPSPNEGEEDGRLPITQAYIKLLDDNLRLLQDISKKHQDSIASERKLNSSIEKQNMYQPGDLVLFQHDPNFPLPTKLSPKYIGPYIVLQQVKNDVNCRHIILGHVKQFHVSRLKIFHGSEEEAKRVAMVDNNQFVIDSFLAYRGDPMTRTTMEFEVKFADGSVVWLPWSKDLFDTQPYEYFCRSRPELFPLIYDLKTANKHISDLKRTPIVVVKPGDNVFVDIRCYGSAWYKTLPIPDREHITYLVEYKYIKWLNKFHTKIQATVPIFKESWPLDHLFIKQYGSKRLKDWQNITNIQLHIIDEATLKQYPQICPTI